MANPQYAEKARERERNRSQRRRISQRDSLNEQARRRHSQRMSEDEIYRQRKAANALEWVKRNPAKACANVVRRDAQKLMAMPSWSDKIKIKGFYVLAADLRAEGQDCEVDHIVPLRSEYVCGLHVHNNLQLLPARSNKSKGNRDWPDK